MEPGVRTNTAALAACHAQLRTGGGSSFNWLVCLLEFLISRFVSLYFSRDFADVSSFLSACTRASSLKSVRDDFTGRICVFEKSVARGGFCSCLFFVSFVSDRSRHRDLCFTDSAFCASKFKRLQEHYRNFFTFPKSLHLSDRSPCSTSSEHKTTPRRSEARKSETFLKINTVVATVVMNIYRKQPTN